MHTAAERFEFAPPPPPGMLRALGIAVLAHLLLLGALTWGINWKQQADNELAVEAELWSAVPQQAAPKPVEAPPPPPPPEPARVQPPAAPPGPTDAEIALARQKKEAERKEAEKRELEQKRLAREKQEREQKKAAEARKVAEDKRKQEEKRVEAEKRRQAQKLDAQKREAREKEEARQDARRIEAQRQENLRRMAGLAGATGSENASGNAQRSAGPSASYAGRIRARIKPNIVFTDDVAGNPTAEAEVRAAPDGTIVSRKLIKSSGSKAWDEAVLKAIDKTELLPRDVDGRVPSALIISFRPKD